MKTKRFGLLALAALTMLLSACGEQEGEVIYLRLLNCEDYIGEDEFTYGDVDYADVLTAFEEIESARLGKTVKTIYDTYDTNETMLSSLKTGKSTYDLICASDYTLQKMCSMGMLQPIDMSRVPNYEDYCSPYLLNVMDAITADTMIDGELKTVSMGDYSVGYMWGTLGILYNPEKVAEDKGIEEDQVKFDMADWDTLWNPDYRNEMSVKDSMRDTYSVGIMKEFDEEIRKNLADSGYFDENYQLIDGKYDEAVEHYNPLITEIFNRSDEATVEKVEKTLLSLKENVFGFEVDSGKDDIVKGHIGINLAWSGDATYAIEQAEGEWGKSLYYSVPDTGGNIWFDGWVMMKGIDAEHKSIAEDFLDFICDPDIATADMECIGYTSFIAGDSILALNREWYDPRSYAMYQYDEEEGSFIYDDNGDYVYIEGMEGSTWDKPAGYASWEEYYLDPDNECEEWSVVDLSYMFEGTVEVGEGDQTPWMFYTDEKETIEAEDGRIVVAGRQFTAQYPEKKQLPKLAIMKDYGDNNKYVLAMWQNVKSNNLPIAGVVVFAVILAAGIAIILTVWIGKKRSHAIREKRRKSKSELN